MQQQVLTSREAAKALGDIDPTTIQRAIGRGELAASRPRDRAPWRIALQDLAVWAASNGYTLQNGHGDAVDPSTGEVLEPAESEAPTVEDEAELPAPAAAPVSIAARSIGARQRLAGIRPAAAPIESNAVVLPTATSVSADRLGLLAQLVKAGQFEAAKIVVEVWAL